MFIFEVDPYYLKSLLNWCKKWKRIAL